MRQLRYWFGASIVLAVGVACSSSSKNSSSSQEDAGGGGAGDAGTSSIPCGAGADGGALCAAGMQCCTPAVDLTMLGAGALGGGTGGGLGSLTSILPTASCVPTGTCSGSITGCQSASNCLSDQVCCSGTPSDGGGGADAGDGGLNLSALLNGGSITPPTTCQTSCQMGQQQQCVSTTECLGGLTCQPINLGPLGGLLGGLLTGTLPNYCQPAPSDGGPVDSGAASGQDAAPDVASSDGSSQDGAGATQEAGQPDTGTTLDGSPDAPVDATGQ